MRAFTQRCVISITDAWVMGTVAVRNRGFMDEKGMPSDKWCQASCGRACARRSGLRTFQDARLDGGGPAEGEELSGQGGAGLRDVFDEKVPRGGIKWCARKGTLCRLHGDEKGQPHGGKCNGSTNVELWKQHGPLAVLPGLAGDTIDRKQI